MPTTIALLVTGALGMLGWLFAWLARGGELKARGELMSAIAGETAARASALEETAKAKTLELELAAARSQSSMLQLQLDSERKNKQTLIDAIAKSGAAVGPAVVDSSVDRLYQDQGSASPGSGGDQQGVSGQPPGAPSATKKN